MYMRLPSAQMAVTQPARENEAAGDRWQGEGRERHGREAGSGLEDGTVGKQIPQPLGDLQGASFPAPGAAPAPGGNRRAWGRSEASSPHGSPPHLLQALVAPEEPAQELVQARGLHHLLGPSSASRQGQHARADGRGRMKAAGGDLCTSLLTASVHSSNAFCDSLWPSGTGHSTSLGRRG